MRVLTSAAPAWALLLAMFAAAPLIYAQAKLEAAGEYLGEIADQQVNLRLRANSAGVLSGSLDHLDPSAPWMFVLADIHHDGQTLSFAVPSVSAEWKGSFSADGNTLTGSWTQKGGSLLVSFARQKFVPAATPSRVDGIWLGIAAQSASTTTRIQVVVRSDITGREVCMLDDLDDYTMGLPCANVIFKGDDFSFDIPIGGQRWVGKLSADGNTLTGISTGKLVTASGTKEYQTPLSFARQTALTPEKVRPVTAYDAAIAPVAAADLESVLVRDLAGALKSGELAPSTGSGVAIAVYVHGVRRVFSFGAVKPDSIFEVGSITKTFTGLMLAQMAAQGKVKLDEPVRELLPPGIVAKPQAAEITLLDLATQRSGLPAMPDNIDLADMDNPYASYHAADLMAYIRKHGVANPARAASQFGSLGFALLGVALAQRAGSTYEALLKEEIAGPLALTDTTIALSSEQQSRLAAGHDQFHGPAKPWDSDALAGAIAIRSTATDMLAYLEANLHPENVKPPAGSPAGATIQAALRQSLQPQSDLVPGMRVALGWLYQAETGNYWHNGATAAHSSYAFFNPAGDYAAVVLLNASPGVNGSFVEVLARHINQRLSGKPAISLGGTQPSPAH
jgi:serine-type D-Ala-D-Ala carboxypeptidase/endopeptidase